MKLVEPRESWDPGENERHNFLNSLQQDEHLCH